MIALTFVIRMLFEGNTEQLTLAKGMMTLSVIIM